MKYAYGFEPYVVIKQDVSPRYDERFLQRFYNKVVHLAELDARGLVHLKSSVFICDPTKVNQT